MTKTDEDRLREYAHKWDFITVGGGLNLKLESFENELCEFIARNSFSDYEIPDWVLSQYLRNSLRSMLRAYRDAQVSFINATKVKEE